MFRSAEGRNVNPQNSCHKSSRSKLKLIIFISILYFSCVLHQESFYIFSFGHTSSRPGDIRRARATPYAAFLYVFQTDPQSGEINAFVGETKRERDLIYIFR